MKKLNFFIILCIVGLFSCDNTDSNNNAIDFQGEPNLTEYNYDVLELPEGLNPASNALNGTIEPVIINNTGGGIFNGNNQVIIGKDLGNIVKVTNAGANLGKILFYDKKLSLNNRIACASCHHQDKAFSDGVAQSVGFEGKLTERNSMAINNPISQNNLFWDSRSQSIKDLSLKPVQNHIEMGMENMDLLTKKLSGVSYYPGLFQKAFGTKEITDEKISEAISQFIASLTTANSKFDLANRNVAQLNDMEKLGASVFFSKKAKCSTCHAGANFSAPDGTFDEYGGGGSAGSDLRGTANIGLDISPTDKGRVNGSFKIPSLRNVTLTAPYMHDGRFKTLDEVMDHYTDGIKANPNLDDKFKDNHGRPQGLKLSSLEKQALKAFLATLSDNQFTTDKKYSNPFKS